MKILRFVLLTFAVLLLATAAQAQETKVRADIPFNFIAGDRVYPAGEYSLMSISNDEAVIRIGSTPGMGGRFLMSNTCRNTVASTETKLVFHRVGGNYFLYQVWVAGNLEGREFFKTRAEKMLAWNDEKPETVIVASNTVK